MKIFAKGENSHNFAEGEISLVRSTNFTFAKQKFHISPSAKYFTELNPPRAKPSGGFSSASAAGVACTAAAVTAVAGESEDDEDGDDHPDKAFVVVEKTAKARVIHGRPPKSFLRIFPPR